MNDIPTVITIDTEGRAHFTRGDKLAHELMDNSFEFGDMVRVTDITMDPASKRYMIRWLEGPYAGSLSDYFVHKETFGNLLITEPNILGIVIKTNVLTFDTYENAVTYERMCLVALRKNGVMFNDR